MASPRPGCGRGGARPAPRTLPPLLFLVAAASLLLATSPAPARAATPLENGTPLCRLCPAAATVLFGEGPGAVPVRAILDTGSLVTWADAASLNRSAPEGAPEGSVEYMDGTSARGAFAPSGLSFPGGGASFPGAEVLVVARGDHRPPGHPALVGLAGGLCEGVEGRGALRAGPLRFRFGAEPALETGAEAEAGPAPARVALDGSSCEWRFRVAQAGVGGEVACGGRGLPACPSVLLDTGTTTAAAGEADLRAMRGAAGRAAGGAPAWFVLDGLAPGTGLRVEVPAEWAVGRAMTVPSPRGTYILGYASLSAALASLSLRPGERAALLEPAAGSPGSVRAVPCERCAGPLGRSPADAIPTWAVGFFCACAGLASLTLLLAALAWWARRGERGARLARVEDEPEPAEGLPAVQPEARARAHRVSLV